MMEAVQVSKNILRKEIKQKLQSLSTEYKKQQSELVANKLFQLPLFKESNRISVYLSTENEVSTFPILKKIFEMNKKCYIPRYDKTIMDMVKLESLKDYESLPMTKWHIKQPNLSEMRENALETGGLDLIIVPGVAFTLSGARMGHGRGYYDAYLSKCISQQEMPPRTVGLAFREQLKAKIPCHDHDILLDAVLGPDDNDNAME